MVFQVVGRPCDCGTGECKAGINYAEQLEDVLRFSMPKEKIGALFVESIQVMHFFFSSFLLSVIKLRDASVHY